MNLAENVTSTEGMKEVIEKLVILSMLDEKVDRLSAGVIGNIENARRSMPTDIFNKYQKIMTTFFDSSMLKAHIRIIMMKHYDAQKYHNIVIFLKQPQIKMMAQREEYAKSPAAMQEMKSFFSGLQASPSMDNRKRLIEQADRVKRFSSVVIDMQVELSHAITWGMRNLNAETQNITEDQFQKIALDMKAQFASHIKQQVWMGMLYAYQDVSDNDLEKYISLNETAEGKRASDFTQFVYSGMHKQVVKKFQCALSSEFRAGKETA